MGKSIDLTGMRFGKLVVEKYAFSQNGNKVYLCLCDCGKEHYAQANNLRAGRVHSCGCLQKEIVSKTSFEYHKKYNEYDLSGEYGIGYTSKGEEFYFDLEDYEKIKDYYWFVGSYGYINAYDIQTKKIIALHRLVMNVMDDRQKQVDHICHVINDNRKDFLRVVTASQNHMNKGLQSNNTSGYTGVIFNKRQNSWMATLCFDGKMQYCSYHKNIEDAIKARKEAEEKYFGEYSYRNSVSRK